MAPGLAGPEDPVALAVVVKPHGLRGELTVHHFNADTNGFLKGDRLWLRPRSGSGRWIEVVASKGSILSLAGVGDRDAAEGLRGAELVVERADLPAAEDDEVYLHDLIGFRVMDSKGRDLGIFRGLQVGGSTEYFVVDGAVETLLPAAAPLVDSVDAARRIVTLAVEVDPDEAALPRGE